jgi:surfeit locus 1 family protein
MRRALWPVLLFSAIGLGILLSLGVWQVQRLAMKEALIARIDQQLEQPPRTLEEVRTTDLPFSKLQLTGHFTGPHLRKISTLDGGPGWNVLQVFTLPDGKVLLVDRGIIGEGQPIPNVVGEQTIVGIILLHDGGQGRFDPSNTPANNLWYWWDVTAMLGDDATLSALPPNQVLHLMPTSAGTEGLHVDPPKANLRNNHLGYAITWFGLAAVLAVMTGVFAWRLRKEQELA